MKIFNKFDGLMQKVDIKIRTDKKTKYLLFSVFLALSVLVLWGSGSATAATVTTPTGSTGLGALYTTITGFVYGAPGLIIAIFIFLFGVIMMIAKHFFVMIMAMVAIVLFFLAPSVVVALANTGAAASGAIL